MSWVQYVARQYGSISWKCSLLRERILEYVKLLVFVFLRAKVLSKALRAIKPKGFSLGEERGSGASSLPVVILHCRAATRHVDKT